MSFNSAIDRRRGGFCSMFIVDYDRLTINRRRGGFCTMFIVDYDRLITKPAPTQPTTQPTTQPKTQPMTQPSNMMMTIAPDRYLKSWRSISQPIVVRAGLVVHLSI
jgi:hypothetical protein